MMLWRPECGRGHARFLEAVPCRHGTAPSPTLRSILISSAHVVLHKKLISVTGRCCDAGDIEASSGCSTRLHMLKVDILVPTRYRACQSVVRDLHESTINGTVHALARLYLTTKNLSKPLIPNRYRSAQVKEQRHEILSEIYMNARDSGYGLMWKIGGTWSSPLSVSEDEGISHD